MLEVGLQGDLMPIKTPRIRQELKHAVTLLRATDVYKQTKVVVTQALKKHEDALDKMQDITPQDLAVTITPQY
jgi:hypothetical protein